MMVRQFYHIIGKSGIYLIGQHELKHGPLSLIWENRGLYGMLRLEVVADIIEWQKNMSVAPHINTTMKLYEIYWDDVTELPKNIAEILLNKCKDEGRNKS